jgi:hypothetical protein
LEELSEWKLIGMIRGDMGGDSASTVEGDVLPTAGEDQHFMESRLPIPPMCPDLDGHFPPLLTALVVSECRSPLGSIWQCGWKSLD